MSNMNPWNTSTGTIAEQLAAQFETPNGAQVKANGAEQNAKTAAQTALDTHTNVNNVAAHTGSNIAQDATHRFVTDVERLSWNAKAESSVATTTVNGLMSSTDKTKLNGISANAQPNQNAFSAINSAMATQPSDTLTISGGTGITVSGMDKNIVITATGTSTPGAHATTHITGGSDVIPNAVANGASGLMSGVDKAKLNGIADNANNYIHPSTHPPSIIAQDASNRFVTDTQISTWNAKETTSGAQTKANTAETNAKTYTDQNFVKLVGTPGIELGASSPTTATPALIDFHSGATYTDFDVRVISTGGNGTDGRGYLTVTAAEVEFAITGGGSVYMSRFLRFLVGSGQPEGAVNAPPGSLYLNTAGGANTTLYIKESGAGNIGWKNK